jgi:hypothetical protein
MELRAKRTSEKPWFGANGQDRTPLPKNSSVYAVSDWHKILPRCRYYQRGCPQNFLIRSVTVCSKSGIPDFPKKVGLLNRTLGVGGWKTNSKWQVLRVHMIASTGPTCLLNFVPNRRVKNPDLGQAVTLTCNPTRTPPNQVTYLKGLHWKTLPYGSSIR